MQMPFALIYQKTPKMKPRIVGALPNAWARAPHINCACRTFLFTCRLRRMPFGACATHDLRLPHFPVHVQAKAYMPFVNCVYRIGFYVAFSALASARAGAGVRATSRQARSTHTMHDLFT